MVAIITRMSIGDFEYLCLLCKEKGWPSSSLAEELEAERERYESAIYTIRELQNELQKKGNT